MNRISLKMDVIETVAELERYYQELKEPQAIGSDAVRTFMTTSPNQWDWSGYVDYNSIKELLVTFTPANTTGKVTAGAYALKYIPSQSQVNVQRLPVTDFRSQQWRVTINGYATTASIKLFIFSTGKGTLTFSQL